MPSIDAFVVRELLHDLASTDEATRRHALVVLGRHPVTADTLAAVERMTDGEPSDELRYLARKYLDRSRSGPVPGDDDRRAKIADVKATVAAGDRSSLPRLVERLQGERDPWVVATLVKAVGALGDRSHVRLLQEYLHHDDARVVANTIEALEAVGADVVLPLLSPLLAAEDNRVRANAITALIHHDEAAAVDVVERMARSDKRWMRDSALYSLRRFDGRRAEPIVLGMLESETVPELMQGEAELLAEVGSRASVGRLVHLARTAHRDKAIYSRFALVQLAEREGIGEDSMADLAEDFRRWREQVAASRGAVPDLPPGAVEGESVDSVVTSTTRRTGHVLVLCVALGIGYRLVTGVPVDGDDTVAGVRTPAATPMARTAAGNPVDLNENMPDQTVVLQGRIRFVDGTNDLVLVLHRERLVLVHAPGATVDRWRPGQLVEVRGRLTGEVNYGATVVRQATVHSVGDGG